MTVSNSEVGDTLTASVTGNAVVDYDGSTALPSGVNVDALTDASTVTFDSVQTNGGSEVLDWTYNPGDANFDFLEPGDKLTLTFKAQITDGQVTVGDQPLTVTVIGGGSSANGAAVVNGTPQNDTFVDVGGGATVFGKGGSDTFVFNKNFGSATIGDFDVNHDTINIDKSLFATVSALLSSAPVGQWGSRYDHHRCGSRSDHTVWCDGRANSGASERFPSDLESLFWDP